MINNLPHKFRDTATGTTTVRHFTLKFLSHLQKRSSQAIMLGATLFCMFSAAPAKAENYYVSPSGNNTTGLSY